MGGTNDERQQVVTQVVPVDPATGKYTWDVLVTSYEELLNERGKLEKSNGCISLLMRPLELRIRIHR
jgi:hypothetical protein